MKVTVSEIGRYFADREFFPDPEQEVRIVLAEEDVPLEKGIPLRLRGSVVPESGYAVVALAHPKKRRFAFALRFEARPEIEAETVEEAEEKAQRLLDLVVVKDRSTDMVSSDYEAEVPCFLQEVKE
jgi:hypothetical protein